MVLLGGVSGTSGFCLVLLFVRPMLLKVISDCGRPMKASSRAPLWTNMTPVLGRLRLFSGPPCLLQPRGTQNLASQQRRPQAALLSEGLRAPQAELSWFQSTEGANGPETKAKVVSINQKGQSC